MSKINWLDNFLEEQSGKIKKTASLNKVAEQIIVNPDEVPNAVDGQKLSYKDQLYKVVNANYEDEVGEGVVLERIAELNNDALPDEMSMEMGSASVQNPQKCTVAPEKAVQPYNGNAGLDIEVRDTVEVDKFNQEAQETESQIAAENAVDRTTPEGKYNRIENRIQNTFNSVVPQTEEITEVDNTPQVEETTEADDVAEAEEATEIDKSIDLSCEDNDDKKIISNRILNKIFEK